MQLRAVIEKDPLPDVHLALPIHNETFLHRPLESHLGKVLALIELIGNVYSVPSPPVWAAGYAVWNHMTIVVYVKLRLDESSLERVSAIIDDEGPVAEFTFASLRWTRHHMTSISSQFVLGVVVSRVLFRLCFGKFGSSPQIDLGQMYSQ